MIAECHCDPAPRGAPRVLRATLAWIFGALLLTGCGETAPQTTSSTHWLACTTDAECRNLTLGARCGPAGHCVADSGQSLALRPVFADELDGATLDPTAFTPETGYLLRNEELQAYTDRPENVRLEAGALVLTARAEAYAGASYTSGAVHSLGRRAFTFGRFEARLRAPLAQGCSSTFWLLPEAPAPSLNSCDDTNTCYLGTWPAWGDVTIANLRSQSPGQVITALNYGIWDDQAAVVRHGVQLGPAVSITAPDTEWHVYALEWGPERMTWFADGARIGEVDLALPEIYRPDGRHPFHQPFHLKLNLAVGGRLGVAPNATDYPRSLEVDWVRVSQWVPEPQR